MVLRSLLILFCLLFSSTAIAQEAMVKAGLLSSRVAATPGETFWMALRLSPQAGWHTYWQNPGASGIATALDWTLPKGITAGAIKWPAPQRISTDGLTSFGYNGETLLLVPVTVAADVPYHSYTLRVTARWLACKNICIPESATLTQTVTIGDASIASRDAAALAAAEATLPVPLPQPLPYTRDGTTIRTVISLDFLSSFVPASGEIFPLQGDMLPAHTPLSVRVEKTMVILALPAPALLATSFNALLSFYDHQNTRRDFLASFQPAVAPISSPPPPTAMPAPDKPLTFLAVLGFAFLGGLLLNIMPCVLPVLALKSLSLMRKSATDPRAARQEGVGYTAGVLACFLGLAGVLLLLQQGGALLGWGYQLQSPHFVALLAYLMFAVGLNLSGIFHLPVLLGGVAIHEARVGASFLTGLLAALVATPCTAPFMAPAIGYALAAPPLMALGVFAMLGLGLAAPFLLLSFFPHWRRFLPTPGPWMLRFKQWLALPMYAAAAWLAWVLAMQTGSSGLIALLGGLGLLTLALWGLRFLPRLPSLPLLLLCLLPLGWIAPAPSSLPAGEASFSLARIEALRQQGHGVLVNVTADWCITCKVNERTLLGERVQQALTARGIVLLTADWTKREPTITAFLTRFNRRGVPLYVYYPAQGEPRLLPQLLTPSLVLEEISRP